ARTRTEGRRRELPAPPSRVPAAALEVTLHVVAGRERAEVLRALLLPPHRPHDERHRGPQDVLRERDREVRHHAPPDTVSLAKTLSMSSSTAGLCGTSAGADEGSNLTCLPSFRPCSSMTSVMSRTSLSIGTMSCGRMPRRRTVVT